MEIEWFDASEKQPRNGEIVICMLNPQQSYKMCKFVNGKWFHRNPFNHARFVKLRADVVAWRYVI